MLLDNGQRKVRRYIFVDSLGDDLRVELEVL